LIISTLTYFTPSNLILQFFWKRKMEKNWKTGKKTGKNRKNSKKKAVFELVFLHSSRGRYIVGVPGV